jgi:hypothetical protein
MGWPHHFHSMNKAAKILHIELIGDANMAEEPHSACAVQMTCGML